MVAAALGTTTSTLTGRVRAANPSERHRSGARPAAPVAQPASDECVELMVASVIADLLEANAEDLHNAAAATGDIRDAMEKVGEE